MYAVAVKVIVANLQYVASHTFFYNCYVRRSPVGYVGLLVFSQTVEFPNTGKSEQERNNGYESITYEPVIPRVYNTLHDGIPDKLISHYVN